MFARSIRMVLSVVAALTSVAAVAGGVGLIGGAISLPVEWLQGSPFHSYVIPGFALAILVGGSALIATLMVSNRHPLGAFMALTAGLALVIFEVVEFAVVQYVSWLQPLFFGIGLLIILLAAALWLAERRGQAPAAPLPEEQRELTTSGSKERR